MDLSNSTQCTAIVPYQQDQQQPQQQQQQQKSLNQTSPAMPDWKSFCMEFEGDSDGEEWTPPPKTRTTSCITMGVCGTPSTSHVECSVDEHVLKAVLETPPLSAKHAGITSAVKAAKASSSSKGSSKQKHSKGASSSSKCSSATSAKSGACSKKLKQDAKNVHSRAYHQARNAALRAGETDEKAKEPINFTPKLNHSINSRVCAF